VSRSATACTSSLLATVTTPVACEELCSDVVGAEASVSVADSVSIAVGVASSTGVGLAAHPVFRCGPIGTGLGPGLIAAVTGQRTK
jgi:hypothetical protein